MMRALLLAVVLACDPGPPKLDDVRVEDHAFDPGGFVLYDVDTASPHDLLYGKALPNGVRVAEGFATVMQVQPIWKRLGTPEELPGALHLSTTSTLVAIDPVPGQPRAFIVSAKAQGTAMVQVTVDGAEGAQTVPFTVFPQP